MFPAEHLIIHAIKFLAWLGENFPDSPPLGWACLGGGSTLVSAIFIPQRFIEQDSSYLVLQILSVTAGAICILLGLFVFFRRGVWKLQDKREKRTISLFGK